MRPLSIRVISTLILLPLTLSGYHTTAQADNQSTDPSTERISVSTEGAQADNGSYSPSISANGRFVVFSSGANNLISGDTNDTDDIFIHDRLLGSTELVSISSTGDQANDYSYGPTISGDGRFVAFTSFASNLISGDTNGTADIFVHDMLEGTTERISVASNGAQANSYSNNAIISTDGNTVAFYSFATTLVTDTTGGWLGLYLHNRETGVTELVDLVWDGVHYDSFSETPSLSADGRYVAYTSYPAILVPGGTSDDLDVFVYDQEIGSTEMVSKSTDGTEGNYGSMDPFISVDGCFVAFSSNATNLDIKDTNTSVDTYIHDRQTGETKCISLAINGETGDGYSWANGISADGRFVLFSSDVKNLITDDANSTDMDIFMRDMNEETTELVSLSTSSTQANSTSSTASMSPNGQYVAFTSEATNLVDNDTNGLNDIFVRDRGSSESVVYLPLVIK